MKGFSSLILLLTIPILIGIFIIATNTFNFKQNTSSLEIYNSAKNLQANIQSNSNISWNFDNATKSWQPIGTPPNCPAALEFPSPVDVSIASGILYPGQIRGSDYKPHGGFRFDNHPDNNVEVRAIMDGYVLKAAKYDDGHDVQISIFFINDCGLMVMHDHLLTLSPKLEQILSDVPIKTGDSRTTAVPKVDIKKGELLATQIGYPNFPGGANGKNIFVDFGLYDLRSTNGINYDSAFRAQHPNINEYGTHALCWFDNLEEPARSTVRSLPAGGVEGKASDYCK